MTKRRLPLGAKWSIALVQFILLLVVGFYTFIIVAWGGYSNSQQEGILRRENAAYEAHQAVGQKLNPDYFTRLAYDGSYGGDVVIEGTLTDQALADPSGWYANTLETLEEDWTFTYVLKAPDDSTSILIDFVGSKEGRYAQLNSDDDIKPLLDKMYELARTTGDGYRIRADFLDQTVTVEEDYSYKG